MTCTTEICAQSVSDLAQGPIEDGPRTKQKAGARRTCPSAPDTNTGKKKREILLRGYLGLAPWGFPKEDNQ